MKKKNFADNSHEILNTIKYHSGFNNTVTKPNIQFKGHVKVFLFLTALKHWPFHGKNR